MSPRWVPFLWSMVVTLVTIMGYVIYESPFSLLPPIALPASFLNDARIQVILNDPNDPVIDFNPRGWSFAPSSHPRKPT